jgi:hypothetical protein
MPLFKRSDGDIVAGLDPLRRFLPFIMPTRTESFVLCSQQVDHGPARRFLAECNAGREPGTEMTLFHLLLHAVARVFEERPRINRFVAGGRIYQRRGVWLSFSGKTSFDDSGTVFTRKREFKPGQSLEDTVAALRGGVSEGRAGKETVADREVHWLLRIPAPLLRLAMRGAGILDAVGLLPRSMIEADPMYASAFVANLGSVGIDACYHHNYEHGTIPIFITLGRVHKAPVVTAGSGLEVGEVFELKYTYDERIEDGFYCAGALDRLKALLEDPSGL